MSTDLPPLPKPKAWLYTMQKEGELPVTMLYKAPVANAFGHVPPEYTVTETPLYAEKPSPAVAAKPHAPKSTEGHTLAYDPQDWGVATVKDSLSVAAAAVCKHWHGNACADHVKLDELIGKLDTALKSIQSTYPADVSKDGDEIDTTEDRADAARYRAFFDAGLPITYLGQEYRDKASLDAAIDAMKAATP